MIDDICVLCFREGEGFSVRTFITSESSWWPFELDEMLLRRTVGVFLFLFLSK